MKGNIALVEPPLSATVGGLQVLVHWMWHTDGGLWFGCIDGDGRIQESPKEDLTIDFRFTREGRWIDVGPDEMAATTGPGLSFAREDG
jgi:hypothetical protein